MYGLALILVIAIMGGVIAYIGDKLGTKIGKKKLSIFKLRPKHTSILVTIVTGILIAATTLGVMTAVSLDVRTALFGMEKLKSELVFLNSQVTDKNLELKTTREELNEKTAEYAVLDDKIKETSVLLAEITGELDSLRLNYNKAQMDLVNYQKDIGVLQATKNQLDDRIKGLTAARDELQSGVDYLNKLTNNLRQGIQTMREGTVIFRAGEVLSTIVHKPVSDKKIAEISLSEMIYQTNQLLLENFGIKDKDMNLLWIAQPDFDEAVNKLSASDRDTIVRISTSGNTIYGEPIIGYIDLFPNKLIYKKGQTIYSEVFPAAENNQQAEEMVLFFLRKVNNEAIKEGILPDPLSGTVGSLSGSELFDTINKVKNYKKSEKIMLSAITSENIDTVGPLKIEIRISAVY